MDKLTQYERTYEKHHGKEQTGVLRWFDAMTGEGFARLDDGTDVFVSFTAIEGISPNNWQWPTPEDQKRLGELGYNAPITITPAVFYSGVMASKVILF